MESPLLTGFSSHEIKKISDMIGVVVFTQTNEQPSFPLKTMIYYHDLSISVRCLCNLVCSFKTNPAYNLLFIVDTGSALSYLSNESIKLLADGLNDDIKPKESVHNWFLNVHGKEMNINEWSTNDAHKNVNVLGLDILSFLGLKLFLDMSKEKLVISNKMNLSQ